MRFLLALFFLPVIVFSGNEFSLGDVVIVRNVKLPHESFVEGHPPYYEQVFDSTFEVRSIYETKLSNGQCQVQLYYKKSGQYFWASCDSVKLFYGRRQQIKESPVNNH